MDTGGKNEDKNNHEGDAKFSSVFEDTRKTKYFFNKYILVRNFLAFLIIINMILGLLVYEYIAVDPDNMGWSSNVISLTSSLITVFAVLTWISSIYIYQELKKEKLIIERSEGFIKTFGVFQFIFVVICLSFHPLFFLVDIPFFIEESYYTPDTTFESYKRPLIEYFIFIQFVVGVFFILIIFLENLKYGNNRADRIARFFGIEADATFVLRACMRRYPLLFVVFLEVFGILFFGVLTRIAETNYVQHISKDLTPEE